MFLVRRKLLIKKGLSHFYNTSRTKKDVPNILFKKNFNISGPVQQIRREPNLGDGNSIISCELELDDRDLTKRWTKADQEVLRGKKELSETCSKGIKSFFSNYSSSDYTNEYKKKLLSFCETFCISGKLPFT